MRKFYLKNGNGQMLDLNDSKSMFFMNPTGLGMSKAVSFNTDGSGFFSQAESSINQINIVGNIVITSNHYNRYKWLVSFLKASDKLVFIYVPSGTTEYLLDVECEYLTKTEIQNGVLSCPVSFKGLSLWYKQSPEVAKIVQTLPVDTPFVYPCTYPMQYTVNSDNTLQLVAQGHIPAAIDLYVRGELVNPIITLQSAAGSLIGRLDLKNTTVQNGQWLHMSSKYNGEAGLWIGGVSRNDLINLNDNCFFRLPTDMTCTLTVTDDAMSYTTVTVYIYEYYESV